MFQMLLADRRTCRIIAAPGSKAAFTLRSPTVCDLTLDPDFHPEIQTTAGRKPASTVRMLAHEMGHIATNVRDEGPGRMDNVNLNEKPVMLELGYPARTKYP